jgi:hypothetical protein
MPGRNRFNAQNLTALNPAYRIYSKHARKQKAETGGRLSLLWHFAGCF